jgi:hypothetical protein
MTIAAATAAVRIRQQQANVPRSELTAAVAPPDQETVLGQLTAFVPADVIVLWSGVQALVLGAIDEPTSTPKAVLIVVGLLVAVGALVLDFALGDKRLKEQNPPGVPVTTDRKVKTAVIVLLAFLLWNFCGPATPLSGALAIGGAFALALIFSFFATKLAELWDLAIPR